MKIRTMQFALGILLLTSSVNAQSAGTASDVVSGEWKGVLVPDGTQVNRLSINVSLKLDDKNAVTGTVTGPPQPGEIKSGSFDQARRVLKFDVLVSGSPTPFSFEGTLVDGAVTGRVSSGSLGGVFLLSRGTTEANAKPSGDVSADLRRSFNEVNTLVTKSADLVPADKYTFRPTQSVRSFGQLVAHIVDSYNYFCAQAAGRNVQWSDAVEKGNTDKATLVQKLKQSSDACQAAYGSTSGKPGALIDNISHTNLHYGNIITSMRLLGFVPPSS